MGKPVKIADVARYMIEHSGRNIELVFTGLRPGEKLHENLISRSETLLSLSHPLISHTRVLPMSLDLSSVSQFSDAREIMRVLSE